MKYDRLPLASARDALSLPELVGAFSHALDLTEGQPAGHCIRACWIGMHVGKAVGLSQRELDDLYYTILLKDLGCSSNAARICELYQADDRAFKQGYKTVGTSLAATIHFVASRTATKAPWRKRVGAIGNIFKNGDEIAQEMIVARCTRGADIARQLRFSERVAEGIYRLDEHWDGSGRPGRLKGPAIPVAAQIALLGQVADVFHGHAGVAAAIDEIARRSGTWFDPALTAAFAAVARDERFWVALASPFLEARLAMLAPRDALATVDEDYLDDIAAAFGQVVDAKSPFTPAIPVALPTLRKRSRRKWAFPARAVAGCTAARCSTTSASSASPTRFSTSPVRSTRPNGPRSAIMPPTPARSSRGSA